MAIDFYTWGTPNGRKVAIMLEACGLPYAVHRVDIGRNEQFAPDFLKINPNGKIPAIVDQDGPGGAPFALWESGAILIYLAEKTGQYLPAETRARHVCLQWLMFQMGGVGPMFGQAHHFMRFAPEKIAYGIERYGKEAKRLYGVMDRRLAESAHLGGDALRSPISRPIPGSRAMNGTASRSRISPTWRAGPRRSRRCPRSPRG